MFQGLRWRLLVYHLVIMAAILGSFGLGVYALFTRNLYRQLDQKLMTLAQAATPSMTAVTEEGETYLENLNEVPWRDIFNRNQQSLEWFDVKGQRLAIRGKGDLTLRPQVGVQMTDSKPPIRAFTVSVFEDAPNASTPELRGYIRASQSTQDIQASQRQLLIGLALGGGGGLLLVSAGGLWLTRVSLQPIEKSYQRLMQFTADASHELRGPLTAIKTSVDVMQRHPERVHPRDVKKLGAIASATTELSTMAEDLLLLARMDADAIVEPIQPVLLNAQLRNLVELYADNARAKGIDLTFQETVKVTVMGHPTQFNRLFSNLIQNALQYTTQGEISVWAARSRRYALVEVRDTGIGIAPENVPKVFDRFWRADRARSRLDGGSGLGLAIVQAITQQYKGKIWVTSKVDQGSCFHVVLPLANAVPVSKLMPSQLCSNKHSSG
jgi:signal transduction histidine kinase